MDSKTRERFVPMHASSFFIGFIVVLLAILWLRARRTQEPRIAGYGTQRMCPSCGLITSRLKPCCLECGKSLIAVEYSAVKK